MRNEATRKLVDVYCDESRQTKDRYMVLGGLALSKTQVESYRRSVAQFRVDHRMHAELKWKKVSRGKIVEYKRFIDHFFALNNADAVLFRSLIIDTSLVDHDRFGADGETGFYKFYYQMLLHCFGPYCVTRPNLSYFVHLDYRQSPYSLNDLRRILNAGMNKRFAVTSSPFKTIEPRDSKKCDLIQAVDVLVGAIGYEKNGYELFPEASEAKKEMADYIREKSGLRSLSVNTTKERKRFTIWNFQLKQKNNAP